MSPASARHPRAVKPSQLLTMLLAFLLLAGASGILTAGLVMPAVGAVGTVTTASTDLFEDLPSELAIPEPSQQSVMLAADGSPLATFFAENRIVVGLDQIAEPMRHAVVAVEDRRFYEHKGIDPDGMARAAVNNLAGGPLEGASTLTQQYVKNVLIEAGRVSGDDAAIAEATETSLGRKLREARLAIALEERVSKDQILEGYLNIAQFGPSVWGVEAAARHYYNKSAAELSVAEAALLAGITQSPAKWDPVRNPDNAQHRRDVVLGTMLDQGYIDQAQYDEAVALPVADMLNVQTTPNGCAAAGTAAYFCEYVVKDLLNNESFGKDITERRQRLTRGGLIIHTTLDPAKQQAAYDSVVASVPVNDRSGIKMALSSVEPGTGKILAMAQNTNFGATTPEDPNATMLNLNVGKSHGGGLGFQSGSSFKVFTLIEWLETGHSLNDRVLSTKKVFPRASWDISCAPEHKADYNNATNIDGMPTSRTMSVLEATRQSVNLTFIEMANQMDMCAIIDNAERMGLTQGDGSPLMPNPAAVLGTNTVTPLAQAAAFATLAAGGNFCTPVAITKVTDRDGAEVPAPPATCTQVLEPDVVNGVNHALQQVVSNRSLATGRSAVLPGRPAAGKTGTANEDAHAWFVGYTPQLAAAVWMGHSQGDKSMMDAVIDGRYNQWVFGGSYPAETWQAYMARSLQGAPVERFPDARSRVIFGERLAVPAVAGRSLDAARAILEDRGFRVRVGGAVSSDLPAGSVVVTWPEAGARVTPGTTVVLSPSSGPAPEPPPAPTPDGGSPPPAEAVPAASPPAQ
ncbi:transglycosylase domain-containing protein [Georgenia sp. AZ-5]|uniref:transglycosylase domain-containing protein n=1 Tax=Georgenia sp. AZ-5 TaxID=3367526 RepID=UPI003754CB3B